MKFLSLSTLGFVIASAPVFADGHASGDAEAGAKVFRKCKSCHMVVDPAGETIVKGGKTGPNLYAINGRTAGSFPDYRYGDSIVDAGAAGLVWTEDDFVSYLSGPKAFLAQYLDDNKARSRMSFKLRKDAEAANVWAYLVSVGPSPDAGETESETSD